MKRLFFCLILSSPLFCHSQALLGIGELKLGRSFTDIQNSLNLNLYVINSNKRKEKDLRKDKQVLETVPLFFDNNQYPNAAFKLEKISDPLGLSTPPEILGTFDSSGSQEVYLLPKYEIASLKLEDIYLLFRDNKLVFLFVKNPGHLSEPLIEKYKPTENVDLIDTVKCTYTFTGAVTENIGITQKVTWETNQSYCQYLFYKGFSSDCKPVYDLYFVVYDRSFHSEQGKYKLKQLDKIVKERESKDKKLLDIL